ncbi:kinase-like domain-containing protein [Mycena amicta]|nr:kinase-like domain-containing protein [Mycena amicta]
MHEDTRPSIDDSEGVEMEDDDDWDPANWVQVEDVDETPPAELASREFLLEWARPYSCCGDKTAGDDDEEFPGTQDPRNHCILRPRNPSALWIMNKRCLGAHLFGLGGYNIVFLLPFEDKTDVLARLRLPRPDANSDILSASFCSEVATIRFLEAKTSIPVPKLYYWEVDSVTVGASYMIMERVLGIFLGRKLTPDAREKLVTQIAGFEAQLCDTPLPAIGCLEDADGRVGPFPQFSGPFSSSKAFLSAYISNELNQVKATEAWLVRRAKMSEYNGGSSALSGVYYERWLELLQEAVIQLPDESTVFRLAHADFNCGNLLVRSCEDPTIVAVIDWEGACVLPTWDARSGCTIGWLLNGRTHDEIEKAQLLKLHTSITNKDGRVLGYSRSHWLDLLELFECLPSSMLDRERLDARFHDWAAKVDDPDVFHSLNTFIAES